MKVSWPRQANDQLRMPPVCVVSGEPATTQLPVAFRNRTSMWLPAIGRLVMSMTNPPATVVLPLSESAKSTITNWRLIAVGGGLGGIVLAALSGVLIKNLFGSLLAFVFFAAAIAVLILGRLRSNTMGADVNGDVISMDQAHPAFVQALVASNQPGMINAVWTSAQQPYPQQPYPQQHYPQTPYSQAPYPQAPYPPQGVPRQGFPAQGFPQQPGNGPQSSGNQPYGNQPYAPQPGGTGYSPVPPQN